MVCIGISCGIEMEGSLLGEGKTYGEEAKRIQSLAGNDRHELHFAEESNLGRGEARRERESH